MPRSSQPPGVDGESPPEHEVMAAMISKCRRVHVFSANSGSGRWLWFGSDPSFGAARALGVIVRPGPRLPSRHPQPSGT